MNNKIKLESLKKRNEELKSKIFIGFNSEKELNNYRTKNIEIFEEYNKNLNKIQELEWEIMTPEEKERHKKADKFLELKAKGEPFDLDEFA